MIREGKEGIRSKEFRFERGNRMNDKGSHPLNCDADKFCSDFFFHVRNRGLNLQDGRLIFRR
jgi:hypothetical protein